MEKKKEYEIAYLLSPEIAEEKLDLETAELQKIISENGGEAIESETPKKRWLAYPVKKQRQAYFGVIYFNTDKENVDKIKKTIFFNKNVLRFLIISQTMKPKQIVRSHKVVAEKTPEMTAPSFEKKLESILNS